MPAGESSRSTVAVSDGGMDFGGLLADLTVAVGSLRERMSADVKPTIPWNACRPVPVAIGQPIPITAGAGTLGVTQDIFGPNDPYWWDVRRLAAWGFTAGTITAYLNQVGGEQLAVWTTPGEFTYSAQKLLAPRDGIVWSASGISGTPQVGGQAIEVETAWLPAYLM